MKHATVLEGIGIAMIFAVLCSALLFVGGAFFSTRALFSVAIGAIAAAYVLYLIWSSTLRAGRVILSFIALSAGVVLVLSGATLLEVLALALLGIWLVRSLLHHRTIAGSLLDAGLTFISFVFGAWIFLASGSLGLGVWGFLLGQSLSVLLPSFIHYPRRQADTKNLDTFERAAHTAEDALAAVIRNSGVRYT